MHSTILNMSNANEPINPVQDSQTHVYWGLTKREYFAAMAMQGLLANPYLHNDADFDLDHAADVSVRASDALLKKLNPDAEFAASLKA